MLVEHGLAGVVAVEGVQRGGAELEPQRDKAGDADDPGEQGDPAVPVAGPAEAAKQAGARPGCLPGIQGTRRTGKRHGDLPRAEERLMLSILPAAAAEIVVSREAPERTGTVDPPVEDEGHDGAGSQVGDEPGAGAVLGGLDPGRVGVPLGGVPVVPPVEGVLDEAVPALAEHLEPVVVGDALADPADQDGGGAGSFDAGGLVGGEDRDAPPGQLLLHGQRGQGVAGDPLDFLACRGGELRGRGGGVGEQLGYPAVAGNADPLGDLPPPVAVAAVGQVQGTGLDVPVPRHDLESGGSAACATRYCRRSEATGSCISRVEVRPTQATGTGTSGMAGPGCPVPAGVMIACGAPVTIPKAPLPRWLAARLALLLSSRIRPGFST